jgi:myo-inositol-1(or 4)-monophosphatase
MKEFSDIAEEAARAAGKLLRDHYGNDQEVETFEDHDIKLHLDVRCQELITGIILDRFPDHKIVGEEGNAGVENSQFQWVVDPIDGTVNYFFGIPHFCVSIALRHGAGDDWMLGVIYDPMMNELWTIEAEGTPMLNGKPITTSGRQEMAEAVVTVGFSKTKASMEAGFERYREIASQVRKSRMMGSAALAMAYIACGRLDAYIEEVISLWDIAAGRLLVEAAGGCVEMVASPIDPSKLSICAWNGKLPLQGTLAR